MGRIDNQWRQSLTRREALLSLAGILAGSRLIGAQFDPRALKDHRRVPGLDEMLTAFAELERAIHKFAVDLIA